MGQIKNIKLHIVTDIKAKKKYLDLQVVLQSSIPICLVATIHEPRSSLQRGDCFKLSMPWRRSVMLVLALAFWQKTVSCLLLSAETQTSCWMMFSLTRSTNSTKTLHAALQPSVSRTDARGTTCVQFVRSKTTLHSSWWVQTLWCVATLHGMGSSIGIPAVPK